MLTLNDAHLLPRLLEEKACQSWNFALMKKLHPGRIFEQKMRRKQQGLAQAAPIGNGKVGGRIDSDRLKKVS